MNRYKTGYKLVWGTTEFFSYWQGDLRYQQNCVTRPYPEDGPLCVFESRNHVSRFLEENTTSYQTLLRNLGEISIFRCLYKPSKNRAVWRKRLCSRVPLVRLPPGTLLADEVVLLGKPINLRMFND